jgi:protein phosphatase/serine/threonine-protein phosphatase Stp1
LELDKVTGALEPGDRFLLCSDGLCKTLDINVLQTLVGQDGGDGPADALIQAALATDARDNITAVVVDVAELGGPETSGAGAA